MATDGSSSDQLSDNSSDTNIASGNTHNESATTSCHNRQLLAKFSGHKTVIRADLWLNLFEVITKGQDDSRRIFNFMAYLNDDALNWFASDIAPKLDDIKWPSVREKFIARFGPAIANPLVESQHRRLKATETVQQYYDDKMRVLRRVTLTEPDVVAQLTEGMPPQYRGYLLCANPQTAVSWLAVALQLESTIRRSQPFNRPTQQFKLKPNARQNAATQSAFVSARNSQNYSRNSRNRPPTPCRHCTQAGETNYHWNRDCPRIRSQDRSNHDIQMHDNTAQSSAPALTIDEPTALANDQPGNFLGGHH